MHKLCLFLSVTAAAMTFAAAEASAQRTFVERPGASVGMRYPGDSRAANSLNHLNRELRDVQLLASRYGSGRAGARLARVARVTDRLNYDYNKRLARPWPIHRRAEALRAEVRAIRSTFPARARWLW